MACQICFHQTVSKWTVGICGCLCSSRKKSFWLVAFCTAIWQERKSIVYLILSVYANKLHQVLSRQTWIWNCHEINTIYTAISVYTENFPAKLIWKAKSEVAYCSRIYSARSSDISSFTIWPSSLPFCTAIFYLALFSNPLICIDARRENDSHMGEWRLVITWITDCSGCQIPWEFWIWHFETFRLPPRCYKQQWSAFSLNQRCRPHKNLTNPKHCLNTSLSDQQQAYNSDKDYCSGDDEEARWYYFAISCAFALFFNVLMNAASLNPLLKLEIHSPHLCLSVLVMSLSFQSKHIKM